MCARCCVANPTPCGLEILAAGVLAGVSLGGAGCGVEVRASGVRQGVLPVFLRMTGHRVLLTLAGLGFMLCLVI